MGNIQKTTKLSPDTIINSNKTGELTNFTSPSKDIYKLNLQSEDDYIILDFNNKKGNIIISKKQKELTNIHFHKYTNLLGKEIPVFLVTHRNKVYGFSIRSSVLYLSDDKPNTNDIDNYILSDFVRNSKYIFGNGTFSVDKDKLQNTIKNKSIIR